MIAPVTWILLSVTAVAAVASAAGEFRLTVLHTNDVHAHYSGACRGDAASAGDDEDGTCGAGGGYGGFARLRAALDAERARAAADGSSAVYLSAGDTFHGTPMHKVLRWVPAADFVGDLGVDAMCLGNHEFEDGPEGLAPFLKSTNMSSTPVVVTNINTEDEPSLANTVQPSAVLTVGGRTVGIVGYLTPSTMWTNNGGKVKITNEIQSLKTEVSKLKNAGVEFVIALGHSGLEVDKQVAREVDGIDAVVGGHSHSYLFSGPPQDTEIPVGPYPIIEKRGEQIVPVVQAYAFNKYLGKLVLTFNSEKRLIEIVGGPILLDQTIPKDTKTLKKIKYYKKLMAKTQVNEVIGTTNVYLDGNCKCRECNLGNLIVDSFIRVNLKKLLNNNVYLTGWTDAAAAISVSGGIQSSINASETQGKIYNENVEQILPYNTPLYKVVITGTTLLKALEHSASLYGYTNCAIPEKNIFGGFMQMSGIQVTYDMRKDVGSRVKFVTIRCSECKIPSYEPVDPDKHYTLIMSKYMANGGDQYNMIKEGIINAVDLNITETEALRKFIKEMSPILGGVDNRIKILH